jgi:hypothetical protein
MTTVLLQLQLEVRNRNRFGHYTIDPAETLKQGDFSQTQLFWVRFSLLSYAFLKPWWTLLPNVGVQRVAPWSENPACNLAQTCRVGNLRYNQPGSRPAPNICFSMPMSVDV